jgi:hypothetical protein
LANVPFNNYYYIANKYLRAKGLSIKMAIFLPDSQVADPTTGRTVSFGSLSRDQQASVMEQQYAGERADFGPTAGSVQQADSATDSNQQTGGYAAAATTNGGFVVGDDGTVYAPSGAVNGRLTGFPDAADGTTTYFGGGTQDAFTDTYYNDAGSEMGTATNYGEAPDTFNPDWHPAADNTAALTDPGAARMDSNGLPPGGEPPGAAEPTVAFQGTNDPGPGPADTDWRVRISLATGANIFYKSTGSDQNELMKPLIETNGVIWPYTPAITVTHSASYNQASITHSNYTPSFYSHSEVQEIQISGDFTVQSQDEGRYLMAAVYFFRAATKMFFGSGANVGNPPPIVFLDGYGSHYFPHVPCVITSFAHTLPADVDYIDVDITTSQVVTTSTGPAKNVSMNGSISSGRTRETKTLTAKTRVPTLSTIAVSVRPMYSRKNVHDRFNLDKFAAGLLLADRKNGYGGFI